MKRPKIADVVGERRLRREKAASHAAVALTSCAVVLAGVKGGMLYDRFPASVAAPWLDLVAVPLAAALAGLALLIWAAMDGRSFRPGAPSIASAVCGGGLVVWTAACLVHTPVMRAGLAVLGIAALAVGVGVAIGGACRARKSAGFALVAVVLVATLLGAMGLREYLEQWRAGDAAWRIFAGFAVPNFLAGLFVMTIPVTIALFLRARDRNAAVAAGASLLLQTPALLLTQSRLGVASLAVGLVAFGAAVLVLRFARRKAHPSAGRSAATRRALIIGALAVAVGLMAARPVVGRLRASRDQSYSARFRLMTWEGVRLMVAFNAARGTGTGSFDVAYPRYARVGYTQHAHNSFLQVAAETGVPGALLLVVLLASVLVAGCRGLRTVPQADGDEHDGLILAGLIGGFVAAIAHNAFDSDLYVPANAVVFGAIGGLIVAYSRPASGVHLAEARLWPSWTRRVPIGVLGLALLTAGSVSAPVRTWVAEASAALAAGDGYGALDAYRQAVRLDPLDPEHRLAMAMLLDGMGEGAEARKELVRATRLASIGKTWYRLGRHDLAAGRPAEAAASLERARRSDPAHLRSRLALAEAYASSGQRSRALRVYEAMAELAGSPVGQVRAIPEVVDWEYGIAFAGLAEAAMRDNSLGQAALMLEEAETVLGRLWRTRNEAMVRLRVTDDVMREATARYEWVLEQRSATLSSLGRHDDARVAEAELGRFRQERDAPER
jgi:O-antigen ligase/tetratricopeptide (TPR) repeat protein